MGAGAGTGLSFHESDDDSDDTTADHFMEMDRRHKRGERKDTLPVMFSI